MAEKNKQPFARKAFKCCVYMFAIGGVLTTCTAGTAIFAGKVMLDYAEKAGITKEIERISKEYEAKTNRNFKECDTDNGTLYVLGAEKETVIYVHEGSNGKNSFYAHDGSNGENLDSVAKKVGYKMTGECRPLGILNIAKAGLIAYKISQSTKQQQK